MDNVLQFRAKGALFSNELKQKLETGVRPFTEKPEETITTVEQVICTHIVAAVRRIAENLGRKFGEKIVEKVSNGQ
jgi:hypothetical protein